MKEHVMFVGYRGYGDMVPKSDAERAYTIVAMVIGGLFYGYVVGSITAIVSSSDLNSSAYYERMELIQEWLEHHKFPRNIRKQIRRQTV